MIPVADPESVIECMMRTHGVRINVFLLDLDHVFIDDLSEMFVTGQVNFDADAEVTRSLDITLFDPLRQLGLDPGSPSSTAAYIGYMIQIEYILIDPWNLSPLGIPKEHVIPLFTGPIDDIDREPALLKIKALGKDKLALDNMWQARTYGKNTEIVKVINNLIRGVAGEPLAISGKPDHIKEQLGEKLVIKRGQKPLAHARRLSSQLGYQLFFDGRGRPKMRKFPTGAPSFIFRQQHLTSEPMIAYDLTKVVNTVEVVGKAPSKKKTAPIYIAIAQAIHPLSPQSLGRRDPVKPRFLWKSVKLKTKLKDQLKKKAENELRQGLLAGVEIKFDGLVMALLEELDVSRVETPEVAHDFLMKKWTVPLVPAAANYGYVKKVQVLHGGKMGTPKGIWKPPKKKKKK